MQKYALQYGDLTIIDGTHNTTVYELKLMPYTNVDCLGKNIVSGILLDPSENTSTVSAGLKHFKLDNSGATMMTDGGSAYPEAASEADMVRFC